MKVYKVLCSYERFLCSIITLNIKQSDRRSSANALSDKQQISMSNQTGNIKTVLQPQQIIFLQTENNAAMRIKFQLNRARCLQQHRSYPKKHRKLHKGAQKQPKCI